jgi:hypothetical protein
MCGALFLDRVSLDKHMEDAFDVQPGDVRVIAGDKMHSAPPSLDEREILFLM